VRCKDGELARGGLSEPDTTKGKNVDLYEIVRNYQAVVAINGDFLTDHPEDPKGIIIRDGLVAIDDDENATLAFMPDGTMHIFAASEVTADDLLAKGVTNAFSFGPVLMNDGAIQDGLDKHYLRKKNPRAAVGMIEPNHFLMVLVQGRPPEPTNGMTLVELADFFASWNCQVAYNMDGGASATMSFMGENISEYQGSLTGQRPVADALMFGTSDLVTDPES
jgi:exopolysaccharide biosynthesis protein